MDNPEKLEIQTKKNKNTICVRHHYTQTNTNDVNKTWALLETTGGKDELNRGTYGKINRILFLKYQIFF